MPAPLSGPGVGLQLPQNLYPTELGNAPYDYSSNRIGLTGGQQIPVPAGCWYLNLGFYLLAEYYDPITTSWTIAAAGANQVGAPFYVKSDGFNWRVSNRCGTPVGGIVVASGGSYVQATTTVAVTGGGGSTWNPIVGGGLAVISITAVGAGYGVPPLVMIPPPPSATNNPNGVGGRPASAYAVIASGTVNTISIIDQGSGYPTAPTSVVLQPNPTDPNLATGITLGTVNFSLTFAGSITGLINTNPGSAIATPNQLSLSISGAGGGATVAPVMVATLATASITVAGNLYGNTLSSVLMTTGGGYYPTGGITLSQENKNIFARARAAQVLLNAAGASGSVSVQAGNIVDGGLFFLQGNNASIGVYPVFGIPNVVSGSFGSVAGPTAALTFGGSNVFDVVTMQPAP
jgi:hypothetical protein